MHRNPLLKVIAKHKAGAARGIVSICSAHPTVLEAAACFAAQNRMLLLVESTCNQVNQEGGYAGMTPGDFARHLMRLARRTGLHRDRALVGGDHIGPYPWRSRPAAEALNKARALIVDCVRAGYTKIHLDTSRRCADDEESGVAGAVIAERAADLCAAAEQARKG